MTQAAEAGRLGEIPTPIVQTLRRALRRRRLVLSLRGLLATVSVLGVSLLTIMAVDALVVFASSWPRWVMSLTALGLTLWTAQRLWVRPMCNMPDLAGMARWIEIRHPELQERLSSAVELLSGSDTPELRGSEAMLAALRDEAVRDVAGIDPARDIPLRAVRPYLLVSVLFLGLMGGLLAVRPSETSMLLFRAVMPHRNPTAVVVRMLVPEEGFVSLPGGTVMVRVEADGPPVRDASLEWSTPRGSRSTAMQRMDAGDSTQQIFAARVPVGQEDVTVRARVGEAWSGRHRIRVVPPPAVRSFHVQYHYPPHMERPDESRTSETGEIRAPQGTTVTVVAEANHPVTSAECTFEDEGRAVTLGADGMKISAELLLREVGATTWSMRLRDANGFPSREVEYPVVVEADQSPTVKILTPEQPRVTVPPGDRLPIDYLAGDDFGLGEMDMLIEVDGDASAIPVRSLPVPQTMETAGGVLHRGRAELDLSDPALANGRELRIRLRARDNRPGSLDGPGEGLSDVLTVRIDAGVEDRARQVFLDQQQRLMEALGNAIQELDRARAQMDRVDSAMPREARLSPESSKQVDAVREHLDQAESTLRPVLSDMADGPFAGLRPRLEDVSEEHIARANEMSGEIKLTDDARQRSALAGESAYSIRRAREGLEQIRKEVQKAGEEARLAEELQRLADAQADLAEQREQQKPEGQGEEWTKRQQELAGRLGELLQEDPARTLQEQTAPGRLARQTRDVLQQQEQLAEDRQRYGDVETAEDALRDLAQTQAKLAEDTKAFEKTSASAKPMQQAAEDLTQGRAEPALTRQEAALQNLARIAAGHDPQEFLKDLARDAGELASRQEQLAASARQLAEDGKNPRTPEAREQAGALAEEQKRLAKEMGELRRNASLVKEAYMVGRKPDPSKAMSQAAGALPDDVARGAKHAAEAAAQAEQVARILANARARVPAAKDADARIARRAEEFRGIQKKIRQKTARLAESMDQARSAMSASAQQRLAALQQQLSREAAELADEVRKASPQDDRLETRAAESAHDATEQLRGRKLQHAGSAARTAAEQLQTLSRRLAGGDGPEADRTDELAGRAADLSRHQQQVAGQIQALARGDYQSLQQLHQQELADRSTDLAARAGGDPGQGEQAREHLREASQQQHRAAEAMGQEEGETAAAAGQSAEVSLASAVDALARQAAEAAGVLAGPSDHGEEASALEAAAQDAADAAGTGSVDSARNAAGNLSTAAGQAQRLAEAFHPGDATHTETSLAGSPGEANSPAGAANGDAGALQERLARLGLGYDDWARLPQRLREQVLQTPAEDVPREYRELVRRYFREVTRREAEAETSD